MSAPAPALLSDLGRMPYEAASAAQVRVREARQVGRVPDTLLRFEHSPVITCGSRTEPHEVAHARTTGVPVLDTQRGGKATYHGPGQVVVYPILRLADHDGDVKQLVCRLEQAVIDVLARRGIVTQRRSGEPGVWIAGLHSSARPRKIASLGLRITRGITWHGLALNVACALEPFSWFTPCGLPDADITSVARELGLPAATSHDTRLSGAAQQLTDTVGDELVAAICHQFSFTARHVDAAALTSLLGAAQGADVSRQEVLA